MYTLSILCSFLSAGCLYASAKRVEFEKKDLILWFAEHATVSRYLSGLLFVLSTLVLLLNMGLTISILTGVSLWMLIASLIALFAPFHRVTYTHLTLLLLVFAGFEFVFLTFQF